MKTLQSINDEIQQLIDLSEEERLSREKVKKSEINKRKKRIKFLTTIRLYLETNPTEEFILKEKDRLGKRLQIIRDGQHAYGNKLNLKEYNKLMGVKEIQDHLKSIRFLLN